MTDAIRRLGCVLVLLALAGSASGAGIVAAEQAGIVPLSGNQIQQSPGMDLRICNPYLWYGCYSLCMFIRFDTPREQAEIDCSGNCHGFISSCRE